VETNGPREKAVRLPALTIAYRTQGLATFPAASSKWALFNSLPVTTPRRRHQTGDDGEEMVSQWRSQSELRLVGEREGGR